MRSVPIITVVILCSAFNSAVAGSLPFSHPGLIDTPNAEVLHHTQITIGGSATAFSYQTADSTDESDFAIAGHLDIGLFNRAMVGITWLGDAGLSGNAKVLIFRENIYTPAIAVGCQNITGEKNYEFFSIGADSLYQYGESQNFSAYIVLSKSLEYFSGIPICFNFGYGIGRFRQKANMEISGISNPFRGLFGSLEYHPARNVSIMLEWDGRDANTGVEYILNPNVRFHAAVAELEQLANTDRNLIDVMQNAKFNIGVEFTLGPFINRTNLEPFEVLTQDYNADLLLKLEEIRSNAREKIREFDNDIP